MVITRTEGKTFVLDSNGNRMTFFCDTVDKEIEIRRMTETSYLTVKLTRPANLTPTAVSPGMFVAIYVRSTGEVEVVPTTKYVISADLIAAYQITEALANGTEKYFMVFKDLPILQKTEPNYYYLNIRNSGDSVTVTVTNNTYTGTKINGLQLTSDLNQGANYNNLDTSTSVASEIMGDPNFTKAVEDKVSDDINQLSRKYVAC